MPSSAGGYSSPERFDRNDPDRKQIIGNWGYLLQTRKQTYQDIKTRFDREFAEEIIYYTYNSSHINRYFSKDCLSVFQASSFEVVEHQITFPFNPTTAIQQALERRWPGYTQFGNSGVLAVLQCSTSIGLIVSLSKKLLKLARICQGLLLFFR